MATKPAEQWQADWALPPGEILLEVLEERGMMQTELARRTDRPLKTISEIVNGNAVITAETAIQLERVLGINARFWNNLDSNYREALARQHAKSKLEKASDWTDSFPVKALVDYGLIRGRLSKVDIVEELLALFGVSSKAAWEKTWLGPVAAFRASRAHSASPESVATWLRWGEIQASEVSTEPFNAGHFRQVLAQIRRLTRLEPTNAALDQASRACAQCGVVLVVTPELPGAPLSGASRWLAANRALIQLSVRYKSDDQLWFSLFHEAGHVLLPSKRRDFVHTGTEGSGDREDEDQADIFAREMLIPPCDYQAFLREGDFGQVAVRSFAAQLGIAPGIIAARLQRDGHVDRAHLNGLKRTIRLVPPSRRRTTR